MKKLDFYGVGPKIGRILIPWLALTIVLSYISDRFNFYTEQKSGMTIAGTILLVFGLIFYFSSVRLLLNGLKEGKLVTNGTFSLCQNPLYMSFILFLIPAIALLLDSWLVLTASIVGFILLKVHVKKEYQMLEEFFGNEYLKYKNETPEFIPLPVKKWFRQK
ncbi:MAG: isoprenylcysteine carboxylmethyltransferase family protein [Prolixibacteraceae bacterium]|nr:isoprenylcysteine carboxylmethyltransferase family protein [Prolixibacteraceae bacterium]